jgi:hypothetical protein
MSQTPHPHDARTLQDPPADALAVLVGRDLHITPAVPWFAQRMSSIIRCRPRVAQAEVTLSGTRVNPHMGTPSHACACIAAA